MKAFFVDIFATMYLSKAIIDFPPKLLPVRGEVSRRDGGEGVVQRGGTRRGEGSINAHSKTEEVQALANLHLIVGLKMSIIAARRMVYIRVYNNLLRLYR